MSDELPVIIGDSPALRGAVDLARRAAMTAHPVLIVAPTGCGKELFAQWIHRWSGRSGEAVDVNCATLPEALADAELFGHGAEAFTGARRSTPGLIERAHGTSFFLDEVTSLPLPVQGKLLRVIETNEVWRVGETVKRRVDVRVIAAAQEDIGARVTAGTFRHDLYQRLARIVIAIPALAARPEEIMPLARHFAGRAGRVLEHGAERVLLEYPWPGNVRELQSVLARACLIEARVLSAGVLSESLAAGRVVRAQSDDAMTIAAERARVLALGSDLGWDWRLMANALGVRRSAFYARVKQLGISLRVCRRARFSGVSGGIPAEKPEN